MASNQNKADRRTALLAAAQSSIHPNALAPSTGRLLDRADAFYAWLTEEGEPEPEPDQPDQ